MLDWRGPVTGDQLNSLAELSPPLYNLSLTIVTRARNAESDVLVQIRFPGNPLFSLGCVGVGFGAPVSNGLASFILANS